MSRKARIVYEGRGVYHCISRVIEKRFIFKSAEKHYLTAQMRKLETFTGCQVLTHCIMSNHFHILLEVPEKQAVSDDELIRRVTTFYGKECGEKLQVLLSTKGSVNQRFAQEKRESLMARMHNLSSFMKALKQSFTQWYNRRNKRKGTIWEDRFKSLLVENIREALGVIAEYIDLNPIRAGIVKDPKDYRWSGYGAATAGDRCAMKGLRRLSILLERKLSLPRWLEKYRQNLFFVGTPTGNDGKGNPTKRGIDPASIKRVIKQRGKLSKYELMHCRVRYFSDGVAIGSQDFIEDVFEKHRGHFGPKRKKGRRKMRFGDWGEIYSLRDLQLDVISSPHHSQR